MALKEFIGKVVIGTASKKRYILEDITSPYIRVVTEKPEAHGHYSYYGWETINGDPFTNGYLVFEDESLNKKFIEAFDAYSRTEDARWEEYGYWMRKD